MRHGWLIGGMCLCGLFVFAIVMSLEYSLSDALGPGPGFFPFWLGVFGLVLCGLLLLELRRGDHDAPAATEPMPQSSRIRRLAPVVIALVAAAVLLEPLGFRLTMLLFIPGLLLALGARSPMVVGLTAVLGSFGVFHVFYHWLKVPLPIGGLGI